MDATEKPRKSLFPPPCYGMVEDNLYRSAAATSMNFEFIKTLNLKSVLVLSKSAINSQFDAFLKEGNIRKIMIDQSENYNESVVESREGNSDGNINYLISSSDGYKLVTQAMYVLLDRRNYPLMICCATGKYMTGVIVGCLRRIQKWSMISIYEEYRRFASVKLQLQLPVEQFIELFDVDVFTAGMAARAADGDDTEVDGEAGGGSGARGSNDTAGGLDSDGSALPPTASSEVGEKSDLPLQGSSNKSNVTFATGDALAVGGTPGSVGPTADVSLAHVPEFIRRGLKPL